MTKARVVKFCTQVGYIRGKTALSWAWSGPHDPL